MSYRLRKAPKRDLYWVVGPDGKKHSKDPIAKDKAEAQKRVLEAAMGAEAPKRKTPKRGKGKGMSSETIKVTNPMGSRKAEKEAREKAELEAYAREHEKKLARLGISPNPPPSDERHPSDRLFEPVLADCFSGIGESCRALAETLGLVKRRGRGRGGKKLKGGGLAEKIAALKEHVRSQYREGLGPTESPRFVDVAMEHLPFETYKRVMNQQSRRLSSAGIPEEELETGYVRRVNELAHEYAAGMAEKHLHPSQWRTENLFMKPHVVYPSQSPSARQLQYRRSHPIAYGPVPFVATVKPEPKTYTTEGVTRQYLDEQAADRLPWSLARQKEINEGLPSDPNPYKGRPTRPTPIGRAHRIILHDRPTRDPSRFVEEGEFGPLPERAAQEEGEPVLGRIFSAAEVADTVAQSKTLEGRMAAALARLGADDDELDGNGKSKGKSKSKSKSKRKSKDESSSDESSSDEETAKLSGGGHFKEVAKSIFTRLVAARRLKPADRRRAENILDRALHKIDKEDDSKMYERRSMADLQARLQHYRGVLARWQNGTPQYRDRNFTTGIWAQMRIEETETAIHYRQRKLDILVNLQNDLTAFLPADTLSVRTIPPGQSTTLLMDDIVNGMEMTDLDRMYYNENPTYFSKKELDQYNATRAQQGLGPQNPTNRGVPQSVHHYLAHIEGEEPPTVPLTLEGTRPIKTTRRFGPFTKYILNPLKHLFVKPREEDFVNIQPGQRAVEERVGPAVAIQTINNPLLGRGNGTTLAADSPPPPKQPHHTDAELTKEDYRRIIRATLSYVNRYRVSILGNKPDVSTKAKAHKVVDRFLSRASPDARHGLNYLIMTKFPIPTFTNDGAQNLSRFEEFLMDLQFPLGLEQEDMYTSLDAMGDTMPHRYEEDEEWGEWVHGSGGSWFDIFRPSRVINEVTNPDSILRRRITDVSRGVRKGYSPSARKTIEAYGAWIIDMVVVRRVPVQAALHTAFELVTLGKWNAARAETNKDKLFHLSIVVRLRKGGGGIPAYVLVEKNEVVNVGPTKPRVDNAEEIRVQSPNVSLETFLNKALEANPQRFFPYDAFQNNCQDFVMMVLGANGLLNNDVTAFVKQPVGDLLAKVPGWTGPVANVITDAAGIANVALEGAGTHRENVLKTHHLADKGYSLKELAKISSVPLATLQDVYNRGIGAYKTNPSSVRLKGSFVKGVKAPASQKLSKEQWAMARVYSFLDGNPKHDNDLRGGGKDAFMAQLKKAGISPSAYLKEVKRRAKKHQYPKVEFATDGDHKLIATDKDGKVTSFGKVGYGDHIIYSHLEAAGKVPAGTAAMKQSVFHKSHSKIKGDWKKDAYSANNLALRILW